MDQLLSNGNYHMGHLIFDALRSRPEAICQIDAATGESETNASVLTRSIQLAKCLRKFGAKPGDVLALGGRNHLDLHIPYYAAIMNGYPIAGVDPQFKFKEIKCHFEKSSPKIAFCQKELVEDYERAIEELGLNTKVICFDDGDLSLKTFIEQYEEKEDNAEFEPDTFDVDKIAWLVSTGGTTGIVKLAIITHKAFLKKLSDLVAMFNGRARKQNGKNIPVLNLSPVQWVTGFFNAVSMPVMHQTKIQTSAPQTVDHVIDIIHKYKPVSMSMSPSMVMAILKSDKECDFSCFNSIMFSGGKVPKNLLVELRKRVPPTSAVLEFYGQTENLGPMFLPTMCSPLGSCGKDIMIPDVQVKLVDPETGKEVTAPYEHGELWNTNAPFSGYYRDPKETAAVFEGDWFKTGDIMYRDEEGYYYFVERLKMLIKYRSYHVIPPEIENEIREHHGVMDVSVTSVDHEEDGEHPVACVVRRPGVNVTAQEIKDLVASKLSDSKRLRGGVVFMEELPYTSSGKVARGKLRQLVKGARRE